MQILLVVTAADSSTTLVHADDFKKFGLELAAPGVSDGLVAAALGRLGRRDGDHVWVERASLIGLAGPLGADPDWLAALDGMIDSVRSFGWVDADGAIRAHVVVQTD